MKPWFPSYIYQMIDHIYISDARGFAFRKDFGLVVPTAQLTAQRTGTVELVPIGPHTNQLATHVSNDPSLQLLLDQIVLHLKHSTESKQPILLYGDDYHASSMILVHYLMTQYSFTNTDILRMIQTHPYNEGLTKSVVDVLSKSTKK